MSAAWEARLVRERTLSERFTTAAAPYRLRGDEAREAWARGHAERASGGDGYDVMDATGRDGWVAVPSWGSQGWDLLEWPYYVAYVRSRDAACHELATYCEGDVDVWRFPTLAERENALDLLAFWHWATKDAEWVAGLDEPTPVLRGPFSWARLDLEAQP